MSLAFSRISSAGLLLIVLSAVLWGTVGVTAASLFKLADLNAVTLSFYRLALSVPALLVATLLTRGYRTLLLNRQFVVLTALMGLAMAGCQIGAFAAIREAGVAVAVLVGICTAPVWVALLSAAFMGERLRPFAYVLLSTALLGCALLVVRPDALAMSAGARPLVGVLWALGSALSYAVLVLCSRLLAPLASPLVSLTLAFSVATLVLLPVAGQDGLSAQLPWRAWALLGYLGVVATALAYVLFLRGMSQTSATLASVLTLVEPLVSVLLAMALFGERLGLLGTVGAVILVASVSLLPRAMTVDQEDIGGKLRSTG